MEELNILIPTDFAPEQEVAYHTAQALSALFPVRVTLLHQLQPVVTTAPQFLNAEQYTSLQRNQQMHAQEQLTMLAGSDWFAKTAGVHTRLIKDSTKPLHKMLQQLAFENAYDVIFTVSRHRSTLGSYLIGSELMRILRTVDAPILCLSPGWTPRLNRALFATDLSPEAVPAFVHFCGLAHALKWRINCVKINTPGDFDTERVFRQKARDFAEEVLGANPNLMREHAEYLLYCDDQPVTGILNCAEDLVADLIVLSTHGRSGLALFVNGSVTQEVVQKTTAPVLVYKVSTGD